MSTALTDYVLLPIDSIDMGERYRKHAETGIDALAESIDTLGLLHPIVVLPANGNGKYPLVAGERRIMAHNRLKLEEIEAHIVHDLNEADRLLAEHNENTCRQQMTPSEAAACMRAREEVLKPLAQEAKKANLQKGRSAPKPKISTSGKGKTSRETAAEGTGFSGRTLEKVTEIETIAANPDVPQEVRDLAMAKLTEINTAEKPKVHPAWVAVTSALKKAAVEAAALKEKVEGAIAEPTYLGQAKALADAIRALAKSAAALEAAFIGADNFDHDVNPEIVADAFKDIRSHIATINKAGKAVKDLGA